MLSYLDNLIQQELHAAEIDYSCDTEAMADNMLRELSNKFPELEGKKLSSDEYDNFFIKEADYEINSIYEIIMEKLYGKRGNTLYVMYDGVPSLLYKFKFNDLVGIFPIINSYPDPMIITDESKKWVLYKNADDDILITSENGIL